MGRQLRGVDDPVGTAQIYRAGPGGAWMQAFMTNTPMTGNAEQDRFLRAIKDENTRLVWTFVATGSS